MKRSGARGWSIGSVLTVMLAFSSSALAVDPEIERVVKVRHENFERMDEALEDIDREIKRKFPNVELIERHAGEIDVWARD